MSFSSDDTRDFTAGIDWTLLAAVVPVVGAGLITMHSFGSGPTLLYQQLLWVGIALVVFFIAASGNYRFLRRQARATSW